MSQSTESERPNKVWFHKENKVEEFVELPKPEPIRVNVPKGHHKMAVLVRKNDE
jgi:hypothetical protein